MLTIKDIARLAKVSEATVSKALNDRPDIGDETKKRILAIAKQKKFTPHAFGRGLRTKSTGNIGLILCLQPDVRLSSDPFYTFIIEGVEAESTIEGYNVILNFSKNESRSVIPKMLSEKQVDGLILIEIFKKSFFDLVCRSKIPMVFIDPQINLDSSSKVMIDNEEGARAITQLLIDKGHERIGFIADDFTRLSFKQRFQGYCRALEYNKIKLNKNIIGTDVKKVFDNHSGKVDKKKHPTAIVFGNDDKYIESLKDISELSLKVPDDLSVAGFDDIFQSRQLSPPLTTVRVYKEEMGSLAVRNLIRMIKTKKMLPTTTIVPVKIIERESVKELKRS